MDTPKTAADFNKDQGIGSTSVTPNTPVSPADGKVQVQCPACKHKFWHKIGKALGEIADGVGNVIGESKFGG
jgi:hypothetical protein